MTTSTPSRPGAWRRAGLAAAIRADAALFDRSIRLSNIEIEPN